MKNYNLFILSFICTFYFISCNQLQLNNDKNIKRESKIIDTHVKDSLEKVKKMQMQKAVEASEKCKIEIIREIRNNIGNLTEKQVLSFLSTFNEICEINVEFSQAANYHLFLLLQKQPEIALKVLGSSDNIKMDYIKKALRNPIHDGIDISKVAASLKNVEANEEIRDSLISALPKK